LRRRIETTTSRTAEITCLFRACSTFEANSHYKSDDHIAPLLIPGFLKPLIQILPVRKYITRRIASKGIYKYIIARTKYIDAVFERAVAEQFDQILIFGAGFDTRALRFKDKAGNTQIFELDVSATQQKKISQYQKRHLTVPSNVTSIAIDFDKESLSVKLDEAKFKKDQRSLFILEGLLMYLQAESVDAAFKVIQDYAGKLSLVAFDYIYASVLRKIAIHSGKSRIAKRVSRAGEKWHFSIENGEIEKFLKKYDLKLINQSDSLILEKKYFGDSDSTVIRNIDGTHCLVTAEKE